MPPEVPAGMTPVTRQRFFDRLHEDPRDIMPRQGARDHTTWEVVSTREAWGWSTPGWAEPGGQRAYAIITSKA